MCDRRKTTDFTYIGCEHYFLCHSLHFKNLHNPHHVNEDHLASPISLPMESLVMYLLYFIVSFLANFVLPDNNWQYARLRAMAPSTT